MAQKIRKIGMHSQRHRPDLLRRGARAAALPHRRGGPGLHLPDAAVPGRAAVGRRQLPRVAGPTASQWTIEWAQERKLFGAHAGRPAVGAVQAGRTQDRGRGPARAHLPRLRPATCRARTCGAGLDGQAQGRPPERARCPTPACSSGAAWASPGRTRSRACTATAGWRSIGGGADEVMLGILAKTMGIAKRPPRAVSVPSLGCALGGRARAACPSCSGACP